MNVKTLKAETKNKNNLDQLVFQVQKFMTESGDKIGEMEKDEMQSALTDARSALDGDDMTRTKAAFDKGTTAYQAAGASVYANANAAEAGAAPDMGGSDYAGYAAPADGAVEGEVTDKK